MSHKAEIARLGKQIAGLEKQVAYWKGDGMERRSKARAAKKAEWDTLSALREQAERALAEERAFADRIHAAFEVLRLALIEFRTAGEQYTSPVEPIIDAMTKLHGVLRAEHAARRGG